MTTAGSDLPPDQAKKLAAFLGEWRVEGVLRAGDDQAAVSGRWRFEKAVDGWGVLGVMDTEIEGMGVFEESELIGFDAVDGKVHMFSMNKFAIRDHVGGWTDENTLVVRYTGEDEGKLVTEDITVEFRPPSRMMGRVVEQADGGILITTDLTMDRHS
jgi:hypothetical protein